ncbi:MAG: sigma-70 family RNA polymerase sigma factor [Ilumatobacteraceae bacterium]
MSHFRGGMRQIDVTMDPDVFEAERDRLALLASRVLGSNADVDDVLQQARLRLAASAGVDDPPAWLTTVVTRLCLDQLRRVNTRSRFEAEAALARTRLESDADERTADQVGAAMQSVLDTLAPAERAAFVLHDVFGYRFDEIATILGRSDTAVRQLGSRARRKLHGQPETPPRAESRRVVEAFLSAARGGDLNGLLSLLAPDAVMRADLVGQELGSEGVYDGAASVAERMNGAKGALPVSIDGEPGAAWIAAGTVKVAFIIHADGSVVNEIELIADPAVLATLDIRRRSPDAAVRDD